MSSTYQHTTPISLVGSDGGMQHYGTTPERIAHDTLVACQGCIAGAALLLDGTINELPMDDRLEAIKSKLGSLAAEIEAMALELSNGLKLTAKGGCNDEAK